MLVRLRDTSMAPGTYAYGFSQTGKFLKVVYEEIDELTIYVITAYEV